MGRISLKGTIWLFVSAILFIVSIFFPWWGLRLVAPQYMEGLYIWVYPYKLEGQIDIINNLNHYVGMAEFSEETFPELTILPYIIGALAIFTIIVALIKNRKALAGLFGLIVVFAIVGLLDLYRWLRTFGTNLHEDAPIKIDPFVPPIFGTNQLANFETFSFFSYGSIIFGVACLIIFLVLWKGKENHG